MKKIGLLVAVLFVVHWKTLQQDGTEAEAAKQFEDRAAANAFIAEIVTSTEPTKSYTYGFTLEEVNL